MRNILALPTTSSSSASLHLNIPLDHFHFIIFTKFWSFHYKFYNIFKPHFEYIYYILQYLHIDVRRDLARNMHGIAICISYYKYVLRLNMAFVAEIFCWWLPTDKVVFRFNLHFLYLLVCLKMFKNNGDALPKKTANSCWHLKEPTSSSTNFAETRSLTKASSLNVAPAISVAVLAAWAVRFLSRLCCITLRPFSLLIIWNLT